MLKTEKAKKTMTIFSEIYGAYFRIAAAVLSKESLTEAEIYDIINKMGFRDSALFLPQKLIPRADGTDWGLLRKNHDGSYSTVLKNPPAAILTKLQKMWLKSLLSDNKINLFLSEKETELLAERLKDVPKLYKNEHFRFTDIFTDGDDFGSERYRRNFSAILNAIKRRELLEIQFTSGHGKRIRAKYLPIKIEYSQKNDKFRAYCYSFGHRRVCGCGTINIGRIEDIAETGTVIRSELSEERFLSRMKCDQPITVRVTAERNAAERFTAEFASYEKHTERDPEDGSLLVKIFYNPQDETELLIRLLSFGPVLEILSPKEFREQAAKRVKAQVELIQNKK